MKLYCEWCTRSCRIDQKILVCQCSGRCLLDMGIRDNCSLAIEKDRIGGSYSHSIRLKLDRAGLDLLHSHFLSGYKSLLQRANIYIIKSIHCVWSSITSIWNLLKLFFPLIKWLTLRRYLSPTIRKTLFMLSWPTSYHFIIIWVVNSFFFILLPTLKYRLKNLY